MPFIRIELIWSTSKVDRVEVRIYIYIYIYILYVVSHKHTHTTRDTAASYTPKCLRTKISRILTATDTTFIKRSSEPEHTFTGSWHPAHNYLLTLQERRSERTASPTALQITPSRTSSLPLIRNISAHVPTHSTTFQAEGTWSKRILPQSYIQPAWNVRVAATDVPTLRTRSEYRKFST